MRPPLASFPLRILDVKSFLIILAVVLFLIPSLRTSRHSHQTVKSLPIRNSNVNSLKDVGYQSTRDADVPPNIERQMMACYEVSR